MKAVCTSGSLIKSAVPRDVTSQKIDMDIFTAVRASNLLLYSPFKFGVNYDEGCDLKHFSRLTV
jgi:hypothetical protein